MREVTVATVQMQPELYEIERNLVKMSDYIATICAQQKVDIIVFPELITTGYECGVRFTDLAQRVPGPAVNVIAQRAADYGVFVVFGLAGKEKVESILYNSLALVGPEGDFIGEYRKVHLHGEEQLAFRRGLRFPIFETRHGMLGLLSGYDLAFPEAARSLALDGAELLLVAANIESAQMDEQRIFLQARALENSLFIAAANRVGEDVTLSFGGESGIVTPQGTFLASLQGELQPETNLPAEGYAVARFDLGDVRRTRETRHTLQHRAPDAYKMIVKKY
jgi:predicted amidohydrolase